MSHIMGELPQLDERRCHTCGDCVSVCPTACLELLIHGPWLPRPVDCISCSACAWVCPTEAITLTILTANTETVSVPKSS